MSRVPLLYVDVLGMKARYRDGGVPAARTAYEKFALRVTEGLRELPVGAPVSGGIQSDAVALQFATGADAVRVGRALFRAAFEQSTRADRMWLRGVILKDGAAGAELQHHGQLTDAPDGVFERHFTDVLLSAINAEQAGFRGQRLLIERGLVTSQLHAAFGVTAPGGRIKSASKLEFSECPPGFQDVLWPASPDLAGWDQYYRKMLDRYRYATQGGDSEWLHASATYLLFAEIDSIIHSLS
jgi:hypothetical protein